VLRITLVSLYLHPKNKYSEHVEQWYQLSYDIHGLWAASFCTQDLVNRSVMQEIPFLGCDTGKLYEG
jgi:hypothetical protein